jgi:hypothetical protein
MTLRPSLDQTQVEQNGYPHRVAADYNGGPDLEVRLSWPEDTGKESSAHTEPPGRSGGVVPATLPSEAASNPGRDAAAAQSAGDAAVWLPGIDARLSELIASAGRLEATSRTLARLEGGLTELLDRVSALEQLVEDRLGHLDDRLEYLAGTAALPVSTGGDGEQFGSQLVQVSAQLESLTTEVSALRRRIAVRGRSDRAS